jgi:transcriptional regulator with XRE-family HTH domain
LLQIICKFAECLQEAPMELAIPTSILRTARDNASLSQAEIAEKLGISGSVISRLEKAETTDRKMAWRYLEMIPTEESSAIRAFYELNWTITDRPNFQHPDREILWRIEQSLQELLGFEEADSFDPILAPPVQSLRKRLIVTAQFLYRADHNIAWVGDLGVGKTTALSFLTNLLIPGPAGQLRSVFPTGSGRMTVCEVVIKAAPAFGIAADCLKNDEVRLLVAELVEGLKKKGESGVTTEIDRVLRNMSKLNRTSTVSVDGKRIFADPIREMLSSCDDTDILVDRIVLKMNLEQRTQSQLILSQDDQHGIAWLAENVSKINHGQHSGFSVPSRITVLMPSKLLRNSRYQISVIDTKGVEGITQRTDLDAHIDDPRTITVLCSKFADAPGATAFSKLREIKDSGSDAVDRGRLCLLVLPRDGEAKNVVDDSGSTPETVDDGYLIREDQIRQAFAKEDLKDIPVMFFDVSRDSAQDIWEKLSQRIGSLRDIHHGRTDRLVEAASRLMANADVARSQQARIRIAKMTTMLKKRLGSLPSSVRPAHHNLIAQARRVHPSSLAASMNRKGEWDNFAIHHILGVGVRADANARTLDPFVRIDEQLATLVDEFKQLADIQQLLASLRDEASDWRQEFLAQALVVGRTAFKPYLDDAVDLWHRCVARWGGGSGYREDVSKNLEDWFETNPDLAAARKRVETGLRQAWRELVLDRLVAATRTEIPAEEP